MMKSRKPAVLKLCKQVSQKYKLPPIISHLSFVKEPSATMDESGCGRIWRERGNRAQCAPEEQEIITVRRIKEGEVQRRTLRPQGPGLLIARANKVAGGSAPSPPTPVQPRTNQQQ